MARLARLALVPLTLAAAAAPALAQADAGAATPSAAVLDSVGSMKLYPFAGSGFDPFANSLNATVGGVPLKSAGISQTFSDGLPVRDLPVFPEVVKANADAQAEGAAMMADTPMQMPMAPAAPAN